MPDAGRTAKGLPLVNLISLEPGEQVTSVRWQCPISTRVNT
ncbi:MAG: hypothetical protein U0074_01235 [Kouleothrix sp.]